jgi:hypothetical protein
MANWPKYLEQIKGNNADCRRRDIVALLEYYGYIYEREARHGSLYGQPELLSHPDVAVRMGKARVLIPKGRVMPEYVADDVAASIEALITWRKEREHAGE